MFELFDFMPEGATDWAVQVDFLNNLISVIAFWCTIGITGAMIYFGVKYRRRSDKDETAYITHNTTLETVWTIIPTLVCIYIFAYGFYVYKDMREPPANSTEIQVVGYRWGWEYTYPNGKKGGRDLVVPLGRPIRLVMSSRDVIHSFFIPAMRVKEDVRPGEYSYMWFTANKVGEFHIFCAEYCGFGHSAMMGTLRVLTPEAYEDFLLDRTDADAPQLPPEEAGKKLFVEKACNTCHSLDGSKGIGPSLQALFTSGKEHKFTDGTSVKVDENYVRESILNPNAKVVEGFAPIMPPFEGQLTEDQLAQLIAYLKTL